MAKIECEIVQFYFLSKSSMKCWIMTSHKDFFHPFILLLVSPRLGTPISWVINIVLHHNLGLHPLWTVKWDHQLASWMCVELRSRFFWRHLYSQRANLFRLSFYSEELITTAALQMAFIDIRLWRTVAHLIATGVKRCFSLLGTLVRWRDFMKRVLSLWAIRPRQSP